MKNYIILLRGVMPMGKNKVPMAKLREVLTQAGFENTRTYIASGNALVNSDLPAGEIEQAVHELIKKHIGADLVVIVRTGDQLQAILDNNPFTGGYDISRVFFTTFTAVPDTQKAKELMAMDFSPEELVITENAAYMYVPGNAARSKLSNLMLEKQLGVSATTRNFNTMSKLIALSKEH
ncbi:DUF1697 domain-containing protein [Negadavirga shengliensis]|uniref:DUF1697 domain-containing protein n=1 Tax=Negadavirga shengliensis TaxID=1389218 RepID=A0ABV9T500_9BACT